MPVRRHLLAALAGLALGAGLAGAGAPAAAEGAAKASLRLKWLPQAQFAGFYVALQKGYYRAEGIDLTINPGGPNLLTENLVATGSDTFGLSGGTDSVFAARDKGLPVVCIGISHQLTPFVFVARKDGPVRTLQDFKGRNVTAWFTGANHVLNAMLTKEGIRPDEVKLQPQQVSVTPFVDGSVDVATATYYNELYTIQSRMGREALRTFVAEDHGVTFPRDTLIVSEATAREKPDLVKGFLRASVKGWKDAFADPKAAVDAVMAVAPTLDRAQQDFMLAEVKRLMTAGAARDHGLFAIDRAALAKVHDLLLQAKVIAKPVDIDAAYAPAFIDALASADRQL
ncbi:Riboflavin-binding protein RibY [Methylobacterium crusticola]|uniref:Thiamine pyrimidine synthase n=1 Tax=Methylobacterium crusticola TaxID=1697972 RepID=A0ABQ4QZW2_9HYPH|nr:ABC transporter substrate-binding protein [Methylobacterium crusticola]GJD50576.1 Riboflavin-binding protein RibY [Methylobacterium crusticola]